MSVEYVIPLFPWVPRLSGNTVKVAIKLAEGILHTHKARELGVELGTVARSYARLAKEAGVSRGTALKAGRELENVKLFEVRHPGGVNARGRGRGGYGVVNTFKALYAPCVRKDAATANGAERAPFVGANGANFDDQTVQDLNTDPGTDDPVKDPVGDRKSAPPTDVPPSSGYTGADRARACEPPRPKMAKARPPVFFQGTRGRPLQPFLAAEFIGQLMHRYGITEAAAMERLREWCARVDRDHVDDALKDANPDPVPWWRRRFTEWLQSCSSASPPVHDIDIDQIFAEERVR